MLSFNEFIAARKECDCLLSVFNDLTFEPGDHGYLYPGDLYLRDNGELELVREYYSGTHEYLEAVLYCFYLETADTAEWAGLENVGVFVNLILDHGTREQFANALLANRDGTPICHHQSYCDANQFAMDATGMPDDENNIDAIITAGAAIYDDAAPFIRA